MSVFFLPAIALPDAERCSEQSSFNIVYTQRISTEQRVHITFADQLGERRRAASMHHHRPGHGDDLLASRAHLLDQIRALLAGGLHLAPRPNSIPHERECQPPAPPPPTNNPSTPQ